LGGIVAVSAGALHSLALDAAGDVWSWGDQHGGTAPTRLDGLVGIVAISAGGYHDLALGGDGTVWSWGSNDFGQLGTRPVGTTRRMPAQVPGLRGVVAVTAGGYHSLALLDDGSLWSWGDNDVRQLGDGTTTNR